MHRFFFFFFPLFISVPDIKPKQSTTNGAKGSQHCEPLDGHITNLSGRGMDEP